MEMQGHIDGLKTEIQDTLAQLRHNIECSGTDREMYNSLRATVHPHYCSGVVNPPCLVCKVDDLVNEWLTGQGQLFAMGGEQTDYREEWATSHR